MVYGLVHTLKSLHRGWEKMFLFPGFVVKNMAENSANVFFKVVIKCTAGNPLMVLFIVIGSKMNMEQFLRRQTEGDVM